MNNKGFSLVELIVVVLIMAIIAVALAPQVMKWVDNSRRSTDEDNYNEMLANAQVALTDKDAYADVYNATAAASVKYTIKIGTSNTIITDGSNNLAAGNKFFDALTKVSANWSSIKKKVSDSTPSTYDIEVYTDGSVRKTANCPTLNSDLS